MRNKLTKLDAIRGFAALYVVFYHSFFSESFIIGDHNLSFLFKFGQEAVILFFLMSGFVIEYSFEISKDKSFWSYFQKRFYRIYIPLGIVMITQYVMLSVKNGGLVNPEWLQLGGNIFMLQDVSGLKPNVICNPYLGNSPLWSLSYEWWFYMSFYLFFRILSRLRFNELYISLLVVFSALTYLWQPFFINRLFMYYGIWWTGVIMAKSFIKNSFVKIKDLRISILVLSSSVLLLLINAYIHRGNITSIGISPLLELRHFIFTIVAVMISLIWQKFGWVFFDKILGRFAVIAPFSYVLYISHYFLVAKADYLNTLLLNKYLAFVAYLIVAIVFSYLVEVKIYPIIKSTLMNNSKNLTGNSKKPVSTVA